MYYRINSNIDVLYTSQNKKPGITDLQIHLTDPDGTSLDAIDFTFLQGYTYKATFTPTKAGEYLAVIHTEGWNEEESRVFSVTEAIDSEGKSYVRAESRPLLCTTCFTTCGDNSQIGAGSQMAWDASDADGWIDASGGAPAGFKQHSVDVNFMDSIWLKEGTIYYMDAQKGSYCDMHVICPSGYYYMYQGAVQQSQSDDQVADHYLIKHPVQGNVPMGDELNTESCSQELPSYLIFRFTATVPEGDNSSYGYMEMELYRQRTVVIS